MSIDSSGIKLEIFWEGAYTYRGDNAVKSICIDMPKAVHQVSATPNLQASPLEEQQLRFELSNKKDRSKNITTFRSLNCSLDLARSINLYVIFEVQGGSDKTQQLVVLQGLNNLHAGGIYQIKVMHAKSGNLTATINEKAHCTMWRLPKPERKDEEAKVPLLPPQEDKAFREVLSGLEDLIRISMPEEPSPYDAFSIVDLEKRLREVNVQMTEAKRKFQIARNQHLTNLMLPALKEKQKITADLLLIRKAIHNLKMKKEEIEKFATEIDLMERGIEPLAPAPRSSEEERPESHKN